MIPILMYHQVAEIPREFDPVGLAVSPGQFEQQMSYFARNGYRCLSLREAAGCLRTGRRIPARSFVLTFDDGYQNVYSRAGPILEKFGFTAAIFLVAGRVGSSSNWADQEGERSGLLMSWAEARDLARRGYVMGSHTLSHPRLTRLDDRSAMDEIRHSRQLLQDRLGMEIDFFSYPYSDSDGRIELFVESAGYTAACAGNLGSWSRFHLWRAPCLRETSFSFRFKASGWYFREIVVRESAPGRVLRRCVHRLRCRSMIGSLKRG